MMALSSRMRSRSRKAQEARKRKQFVRIKRRKGGKAMAEQNFSNHGRFFPPFHFFVVPVMTINFFWSIYRWKVSGFSLDGFESVVVAAALVLGFLSARIMALTVQDRLIRLEEQLRYERVLPEELRWRGDELAVNEASGETVSPSGFVMVIC